MNASKTTATLWSAFIVTLFPVINAPISYNPGISRGKLNGLIIATVPNGNLYPEDCYPK